MTVEGHLLLVTWSTFDVAWWGQTLNIRFVLSSKVPAASALGVMCHHHPEFTITLAEEKVRN